MRIFAGDIASSVNLGRRATYPARKEHRPCGVHRQSYFLKSSLVYDVRHIESYPSQIIFAVTSIATIAS